MGGSMSHKVQKKTETEVVARKNNNNLRPLTTRDVSKRTEEDLEKEFDSLYEHSKLLLASMASNPCEQLAERIRQCLDDNRNVMINCFKDMSSYQNCVLQNQSLAVKNKLSVQPLKKEEQTETNSLSSDSQC